MTEPENALPVVTAAFGKLSSPGLRWRSFNVCFVVILALARMFWHNNERVPRRGLACIQGRMSHPHSHASARPELGCQTIQIHVLYPSDNKQKGKSHGLTTLSELSGCKAGIYAAPRTMGTAASPLSLKLGHHPCDVAHTPVLYDHAVGHAKNVT